MTVIELIIRTVCREAGVSRPELLSARRAQHVVHARQVAMWLAKRHTSLSLTRIGQLLQRDHTTVLHAVQKIDALRAGRRDHLAYPEHGQQLLMLAERCDAAVQARLGDPVPQEPPTLQDYLAAMRRRHVRQVEAWRREHERIRERRQQQGRIRRIAPPPTRLPRQVPMSGSMRMHVPRGRTLTQQLLGDPLPGRSATDKQRSQPRISWQERIRASLSISGSRRKEEMTW